MMRKFAAALVLMLLACSQIAADEYDETILPGLWHIKGRGFGEYSPVRLQLSLTGNMDVTTAKLSEISADNQYIKSGDETIPLDLENNPQLADMKALTGYKIYMRLNLTGAGFKAWDEDFPNGIRIPVLLPNMRPTVNDPFVLPGITYDNLTYQLSFTSPTSGKVRINGYTEVEHLGNCEINADCAIWRDGYPEPSLEEETKSGCDSGMSALMLLLVFMGVNKLVRN
ncbi:MAG: hypothetical protein IJS28_06510 [Synergistaceae bacterium]|nr:hypothetical protein [Synergistaceae bacterium]